MYHYNTLYIDVNGDTIIRGKMIIKPLDKPWLFQPRVQEAFDYIHINDTSEFNKYIDPDMFFYKRQQKYYKKHGAMKLHKKERSGGGVIDSNFYIHPPRVNQFRMLFYSAHPTINYHLLRDTITSTVIKLRLPGFGVIFHKFEIKPLEMPSIKNIEKNVRIWGIQSNSKIEYTNEYTKEYNNQFPIYNSTLEAEFSKEYGFIKMHYTFENGIKIQFDFVKMTEE